MVWKPEASLAPAVLRCGARSQAGGRLDAPAAGGCGTPKRAHVTAAAVAAIVNGEALVSAAVATAARSRSVPVVCAIHP